MNNLLICDFNNMLFRMLHIHKGLSHRGIRTGGIYGFIQLFSSYVNKYKPEKIFVCNDSPPLFRKELYPDYKGDRKKSDPEFYKYITNSREFCKEFLNKIGIGICEYKGLEADDLITILTDHWRHRYNSIIIASNDDDLYSLLVEYDNVVLLQSKYEYKYKDFKKDYPTIEPKDWFIIKTVAGGHNNIKPVKSDVGIKTAIKIYSDKLKWFKFYNENKRAIDKNYELVVLPFIQKPYEEIINIPESSPVKQRTLENWLMNDFGIDLTFAMSEAFGFILNKKVKKSIFSHTHPEYPTTFINTLTNPLDEILRETRDDLSRMTETRYELGREGGYFISGSCPTEIANGIREELVLRLA